MFNKLKIFLSISFLFFGCSKISFLETESNIGKIDSVTIEKEILNYQNSKNIKVEVDEKISNEILEKQNSTNEVEESIDKANITIDNLSPSLEKNNLEKDKLILADNFKYSNLSFYAVDLKSGKVLEDYRGKNVAIPASVMKIVTSAVALEVLGKDTRLETKVYYDGKINSKGILNGDIYIQGGGDPTLGSNAFKEDREAFLNNWIASIKKLGIKSINGEIIVIDDLFGYEGVSGKWLLEDIATGFGQGVYGISIFDNIINLVLSSDDKKIKLEKISPKISKLKFINQLKISQNGKNKIYVRGLPFESKRVIMGQMAKNVKRTVVRTDIPDPGFFLGEYFRKKLQTEGIKVNAVVKTRRTTSKKPKNPRIIAVTKSKTIGEIVNVLLTRSDNHYTESLYQLLKTKNIDIEKYWKSKNIDTTGLLIYDGSGLSRSNNLSAKMLVDILQYIYINNPEYIDLLPRAGYEGTVHDFLPKTRFDGIAKIKSGSMTGIQSYAGYLEKDGKEIVFTIIVNQWEGKRKNLKLEIEKMLKNLF